MEVTLTQSVVIEHKSYRVSGLLTLRADSVSASVDEPASYTPLDEPQVDITSSEIWNDESEKWLPIDRSKIPAQDMNDLIMALKEKAEEDFESYEEDTDDYDEEDLEDYDEEEEDDFLDDAIDDEDDLFDDMDDED